MSSLALMPERGRDLILAGAILSILINPFLFAAARPLAGCAMRACAAQEGEREGAEPPRAEVPPTSLTDHIVLVGYVARRHHDRHGSEEAAGRPVAGRRKQRTGRSSRRRPRASR